MYNDLQQEIARKNLTENFHFAGLVAPEKVADYLAQADLLWHLSLREGLPRSVVQALASGIPAIGFALDGTPEVVINDVTGMVVPPEDVDAVVQATRKFLENPEFAAECGKRGQEMVKEQFSWPKMAAILESDYRKLLAEKGL